MRGYLLVVLVLLLAWAGAAVSAAAVNLWMDDEGLSAHD